MDNVPITELYLASYQDENPPFQTGHSICLFKERREFKPRLDWAGHERDRRSSGSR